MNAKAKIKRKWISFPSQLQFLELLATIESCFAQLPVNQLLIYSLSIWKQKNENVGSLSVWQFNNL